MRNTMGKDRRAAAFWLKCKHGRPSTTPRRVCFYPCTQYAAMARNLHAPATIFLDCPEIVSEHEVGSQVVPASSEVSSRPIAPCHILELTRAKRV